MIPSGLKRWVLVWAPVAWIVLELVTYPKEIIRAPNKFIWQVSIWSILKGFISPTVADYPAYALLVVAVIVLAIGALGLVRRRKGMRLPLAITAVGLLFLGWFFWAAGTSLSLTQRPAELAWLWQTLVLVAIGACVWTWGVTNPERANLLVWKRRQIWKLYRANWQGMVGLNVMVFFMAMALLAPFLAAHYMLHPNTYVSIPYHAPFWSHQWGYYTTFGSTELGQSVLAEFIWSARISLVVGFLATAISTLLGASIGIGAGYYAGWQGEVLMRITDVFLVIPWLPLAMVLAAAWGTHFMIIMLIIGITSWPTTTRVVRADVLRMRELQFIERAKAIGSSSWHIMNRHILPNVFPLIFANTILVVAWAILAETTLSFLGLGDPLNFSWGTMLHYVWSSGGSQLPSALVYVLAPGFAIVLVVVAFTFMGTAFDEVLDPKLRKREEGGGSPDTGADRLLPLGGGVGGATDMADVPSGGTVGGPGGVVVAAMGLLFLGWFSWAAGTSLSLTQWPAKLAGSGRHWSSSRSGRASGRGS